MRIGCDCELSPYSISLNVSTERAGRKETGSAVGVLTRSLKRIKAMRKKSTKRISNSARRTKRNTLSTALVKSPGSSLLLPPAPMPRWCRIAPGQWIDRGSLCLHRIQDVSVLKEQAHP
jgi:hypothetical protein